jgi:translation elongation factor EF-G
MTDLIPHGLKVHLVGQGKADLAYALGTAVAPLQSADCAIFIVSAKDGIVRADSDSWTTARELYIPSIVVITDLTAENETDFEDMAAIAGRILDPVVTPYLVLHLDDGTPIALIDLITQKIIDYSESNIAIRDSDHEHQEVIAEFRDEYIEALKAAGEDAFENALLYPALPWIIGSKLGLAEIALFLQRVPRSS